MKDFFRSVAGKTILCFLCILMVIVLGCSCVGAYLMISQTEMGVYTRSEKEILDEVAGSTYRAEAYDILWNALNGDEYTNTDNVAQYRVQDIRGNVLKESAGAGSVSDWTTCNFYVTQKGATIDIYWDSDEAEWLKASAAAAVESATTEASAEGETEAAAEDKATAEGEIAAEGKTAAESKADSEISEEELAEAAASEYKISAAGDQALPVWIEETTAVDEQVEDPEESVGSWYTVMLTLQKNGSRLAEYKLESMLVHVAYTLRYAVYFIILGSFLIGIISYITLLSVSGHRPGSEEILPGPCTRVPFELLIGLDCFIGIICCWFVWDVLNEPIATIIGVCCIMVLAVAMFLGLSMTAATRVKLRMFWRTTLLWIILNLCGCILRGMKRFFLRLHRFNMDLLRGMPLVRKTILGLGLLTLVEFIVLVANLNELDNLMIFFFLEKLIVIPAVIYLAICMRRLQAAGRALADGDLSYVTDTDRMIGDLREHGENLNSIAGGMSIAVEDRLKSERMKTELITNVSHDLKTPLTSIINYAGLISQEPCENEKITEYSEVLVRQSDRLKRLIEDLVEASRASTGNLEVHLSPCDASVFLGQAGGEYEEKLARSELTLVTKIPEEEIRILADGRRMWRIFDNLMNNICKYAQSGTRVYLSLEKVNGNAVITFKNTSREALDMSEEELMERFTRGDSSRHTEGNGLGLSIARSMAELQHGTLHLDIDGDLFKAILTFPAL